jgi:hypothetical protein
MGYNAYLYLPSCLACSATPGMGGGAIWSSEKSVDFQRSPRHHIPEDRTPHYGGVDTYGRPDLFFWYLAQSFHKCMYGTLT